VPKFFPVRSIKIVSGGDIPPGAAVISDAMGPLTVRLADTNVLPTDAVTFSFNFPESIAAQSDAVSFMLQFPDTNALPTDAATFALTATYSDINVVPSDEVTFTFNFPETNDAQSETVALQITGFDETNAGQTDDFFITIQTADSNASQTDASTFTLYPTYNETNDTQSETYDLTISGFAETSSTPIETATAKVVYLASGSFTVPTGITQVIVECWAGGAGGAPDGSLAGGNGGGGGAYSRSTLTVTPGNTYTVTRGAGGASNTAGADSWFGSAATILAKGGTISTGGQASAGIGDVKFSGGLGATGATAGVGGGGGGGAGDAADGGAASGQTGGTGGVNGGGNGGDGGASSTVGSPGVVPGGGGGGGGFNLLGTSNGGAGANGKVTVQWTLA